MKKILFICLMLGFYLYGWGEKVAELPEVLKPKRIKVYKDQLYVSVDQDHGVLVYSLQNYKLKNKYGAKGEGPGEIKRAPLVFPRKDSLILSSRGKVLEFSQTGKLLWEKRVNTRFVFMRYIGGDYIGAKFYFDPVNITHMLNFWLVDIKTGREKMLYSGRLDAASAGKGGKFKEFKMLVHHLSAYPYKDKVFIADSRRGLYFKVFDKNGNYLYTINPDIKMEKVTAAFKKDLIGEYRRFEKELWPLIKGGMVFYDYYPPIRTCFIEDNRIYITTYLTQNNRHELIILDLKGTVISRLFIPVSSWNKIIYNNLQQDLFTINQGKFYELVENPDDEIYELHITDLKNQAKNGN